MNATEILASLTTRRAETLLQQEWETIERALTAAAKTAGLNQLVSVADTGYDQTFEHGLEVRDVNRARIPLTHGHLRLNVAALLLYARRSHRQTRLPELLQQATAELETRLLALSPTTA